MNQYIFLFLFLSVQFWLSVPVLPPGAGVRVGWPAHAVDLCSSVLLSVLVLVPVVGPPGWPVFALV